MIILKSVAGAKISSKKTNLPIAVLLVIPGAGNINRNEFYK
jgi:hypothetical protein